MMRAPFAPFVAGAEGLDRSPGPPTALRDRMASVYGVKPSQLLPVRGAFHGLELVLRRALAAPARAYAVVGACGALESHAALYGFERGSSGASLAFAIAASPDPCGMLIELEDLDRLAAPVVVIDETAQEFSSRPSMIAHALQGERIVVLRSLELAFGLAGAPCGALIGAEALVAELERGLEPDALATPVARLALTALDPSRRLATDAAILAVQSERARLAAALGAQLGREAVAETDGPWIRVSPDNLAAAERALRALDVSYSAQPSGLSVLVRADPAANERMLAAFGAPAQATNRRRADVVRDTRETRIAVSVDLDSGVGAHIETGVGYFDHMLEQVAAHGGFSLTLGCAGDTHIDAHHTIEDCALAVGSALKGALGDRRGIQRFGFVLPMDETEARVSIDLGGRPYCVFKGSFAAPLIGAYPTEMTAHVFRSLSEAMGASIHVEVAGDNDHHKTEACFKAFGRALREAIRVEGSAVPSTKGVI